MRIAIVNDALIAIEALRRVLKTVPDYKIAWIAGNGAEAVTKCAKDTPDLILMDLVMPVMDGVEATRRIMADSPCAILLVTATVEGHMAQVFQAMGYGALDVVNTPILGVSRASVKGMEGLLSKIATIGKLIGKSTRARSQHRNYLDYGLLPKPNPLLVVIGASTGGPQALATILSGLDAQFSAAIVVIQHVDVQFVSGLTTWLNAQTPLSVQLAIAGQQPEVGKILIAASNDHLVLRPNLKLAYTRHPLDYPYRPSVDVFFRSVIQHWQGKGVGVLLTGMGKDGAEGLKLLRSAGWHTIAQNQSSCIVYGMPKAAVELGAAGEILPIEQIAPAILKEVYSQQIR